MALRYAEIAAAEAEVCRDLCNALMTFQATVACLHPERLAGMTFESRMLPALAATHENLILAAFDDGADPDIPVGYAYASVVDAAARRLGDDPLVDPAGVTGTRIGIFNNFFVAKTHRASGAGSEQFARTMALLESRGDIADIFVFVSNGNDAARAFYERRG